MCDIMREFDMNTIKIITAFEKLTHSEVRDCIVNEDSIYFIVNQGKMALTIGKGGKTIKSAEKTLKKQIKVFEYSSDKNEFIKNLVPQATKIKMNGNKAIVSAGSKRGIIIGKNGSNIKCIKMLLERNSSIKNLEVK